MKLPRSPDELERLAQRRASAKMGWFIHLAVYVLVNAALFTLSSQFGMHRWSIFPAAGWGLGLILHGVSVWLLGSGSSWREKLVEREREKLRRQFNTDDPPHAP